MFWESLFYLFVMITCVLGIATFLQWIAVKILTPRKQPRCMLLLPLQGKQENMEVLLRGVDMKARLMGSPLCDGVLVVDCGLEPQARQDCEEICGMLSGFQLCGREELSDRVLPKKAPFAE